MANISITATCNRTCRYCFARHTLAGMASPHLDRQTFDATLDMLVRAGIDQVRILGGEPTCHPDFPSMIERALERGMRVMVFSNGMMPERALQTLERTSATVLVNVNEDDLPRQRELFRRLGSRVSLGRNIDHRNVELEPLLDLIAEYSLAPAVRLGLAHPAAGSDNAFLHPRMYAAVGVRIGAFAKKAKIRIELDCGFVPCMFTPQVLEAIGAADVGQRCNAIPDILPDGSAIACYPLAPLWRAPDATRRELAELRAEADDTLAAYRTIGVFRECATCALRRAGTCRGGCVAAAMRRLRGERAAAERPHARAAASPARFVIPYVDQPLDFWQRIRDAFGERIREVYFPLPGGIVGSGRPPQPEDHLEEFLRSNVLGKAVLINPISLGEPLAILAPRLLDALRRMAGEYGVTSVTIADLELAKLVREHLPQFQITASTLMEIADARAAAELNGICDHLVPASAIMRDLPALRTIRRAFQGGLRLLVNESCLSRCAFRTEHFRQMAGARQNPASLCEPLLSGEPWQRVTGSFVLPQHLHFYDGLYDDLKLAGRVTLSAEAGYFRVLGAYVHRRALEPAAMGGGPASPLDPIPITESFYRRTLVCGHRCASCTLCRDYVHAAAAG